MARFDLLRAVRHAASCITKWTEQQDVDLFRSVCYFQSTTHYIMIPPWFGDRMGYITVKQHSDADLASDVRTHRSTYARRKINWTACARANESMAS
eukprot:8791613-Pyramimonas_sp.AAC.1